MDRRTFLSGAAALLSCFGASAAASAGQRGNRVPRAVTEAVTRNPRYAGSRIVGINIRRGASTRSGTLYEVRMQRADGLTYFVFVDPDTAEVLYDTQ